LGSYGNVGDHDNLPHGSRLRLSERRDHTPLKGDIFETADTGQIIKARIEACREEKPNGWGHPFFHVTAIEI
jgi:hypothetical protein